jgi:hypothetical protein
MNADQHQMLALDDPNFRLVDGRTRPDFMLIGAAKCGSTSFARYLIAHPQVSILGPKEPNYWTWRNFHARYQEFFVNESPVLDPGPDQTVSGEFSTSYLLHPLAPRRIRANLPNLRIFALLRNPVDRAYSHFIMSKKAGHEEECSFGEIVRREIDEVPQLLAAHERSFLDLAGNPKTSYSMLNGAPIRVARHEHAAPKMRLRGESDLRKYYFRSYVFRSLYHDQLHRWLRLLPREQLMIIQSERFYENVPGTMNDVAQFLRLQPFEGEAAAQLQDIWDAGDKDPIEKPQDYSAMDDATRGLLTDFFEPHNQQLYQLIDEDFGWS